MAPNRNSHGNRGKHPRRAQNDILDSFDELTDTQLGLDHIERPANIQIMASKTRPHGNRGKHQRPAQNEILDSLDDLTETQLDHIGRTANSQVRKPRTNRGWRQRTELNNDIHYSLNESSEREIVQNRLRNTSENVQEGGGRTSENNSDNVTIELGTIARNGSLCPLHYTDWRLMPNSYKEDMLREVKSRFTMCAGSDSFILQSINHKWRNWKCQLKNLNFVPSVSIEEQLLKVPERVNADQYKKLLDHWNTDKAQELSGKKKEARAKLEIPHRMGKRSYAVMAEVMYEQLGRHPTRAELFEKCCYPPNGSATSETVREAIEKMKELSKQDDGNLSDCDVVHDADDAFAKILGKDKDARLRMYGMGVKPSDIYGGRPSRDALHRKSMEDKEEMIALKQKLEELTALVYSKSHSDRQIQEIVLFIT